MKTVIVVRPGTPFGQATSTFWRPVADAFEKFFEKLGWNVRSTDNKPIVTKPDLVAGYGWREAMRNAHQKWPDRVLHCDLGFWSRSTALDTAYLKLALGGRWSPLSDHEYDGARLATHDVKIHPSRAPGKRALVCGMSAKAANTWNLQPEEWETAVIKRLRKAGADAIVYRPKPTWPHARPIRGAEFDNRGTIQEAMRRMDVVVSHHSNCAIDALAAGLPIYVETGIAQGLSVPSVEEAIGAVAPGLEARTAFLRQVAWHQWRLDELREGKWLEWPAPLYGHPRLTEGIS